MTAVEFLSELNSLGVKIWIEDDQLRYRAPKGVMTSAIKQELGERKTEILAFLKEAKTAKQFTSEPILAVKRDSDLPLSFSQQRMWFLYQLDSNSPFYNESFQFRINGALNVAALEQSINEIIRRHEALRTIFPTVDGFAVQQIIPTLTINIPVVDLQGLKEAEIQQIVTQEVRQPFDLGKVPLLRATVLHLGTELYLLILTIHHIIIDGWSMGIFIKELSALYQAFTTGSPNLLPELTIQYPDFAVWQRKLLAKEVQEKQLEYWKQQLAGTPPLLELPTDYPRPPVQTFSGATKKFQLEEHLTSQLVTLSQKSGVTLFLTLLAAFAILLHRYTGQDDICIGSPFANRNRTEVGSLIGFFVNSLVLRTQIKENPSFSKFLTQVQSVVLDAHAHQDVPFEQVVEALQPERSLGYNPLFQVMFVLENFSLDTLELPGITLTPELVERGTTQFDLSLAIWETQKGLMGSWEYNSDLFDAATIARITLHFQTLLEAIVEAPDQRVWELPLLTEKEQHQLLVEWNDTTRGTTFDKCIHQLFEEQVKRSPDAIAVVFEEEQLTYRELNQRANRIADHLITLGVGPEVLVGICVERSPLMVVGLLGILKAGGAYVPLDPAYPGERLAYMLSDSKVLVLLTQEKLANLLPVSAARVIYLDNDWLNIGSHCEENPLTSVKARNLAYVIYTSGSTGQPKGVIIEHRSVVNFTSSVRAIYNITQKDRVLQFASIAFDWAVVEIFPGLSVGATLVLRTDDMLMSGSRFLQRCREWKVTIMDWPTSHWHQVMVELAAAQQTLPESLRVVSVGGEAVKPQTLKLWLRCVKGLVNPPQLLNGYGPTEATVVATYHDLSEFIVNNPAASSVPIGTFIENVTTYVLDRHLQPVPIGVTGELHIGGLGLARGYLGRPEVTAEKFIPNPFSNEPDARLYKTGDLVRYLSDGSIEFLGRIDNQVKIRGFRIELGEIEAVLTAHPQVSEAVVIVHSDSPDHKRLVAYVVAQEQSEILNQLRDFLKQKLPNYMVPSVFVILDALPLTPNSKVDRRALRAPDTAHQERETNGAPRTESEEILAQIWREVLHQEQVGIHDNFFELGGDSILSMMIIFKANQAGFQLSVKQIFEHQTIAELAAFASAQSADGFRRIATPSVRAEQGLVSGLLPLTPIQHWFFEQNLPEPHHFNQSFLLEIPQTLDPTMLSKVVQQLLVHHDALRLRFVQSDSDWEQINTTPDDTIPFFQVNLSAIPDAEQKAAIEAAAASLQASLNLSSGPIVQVAFFALGTDKPSRLLIIIHHLAVDGVSWRILLEDLFSAYQQISRGEAIVLPPKTTSFKDWAVKLTNYAHSDTAKKELTYWQGISRTQITRLPVDNAFGANTVASARTVSVSLSPEETRALLQEVPKAYKTQINDILLTALVQALGKWTGSNSVLLDLEGHGREDIFEDVDLSRTVGWFTTIFPVLLELKATDNLGDAIKSIKEQLGAVPNRGIGYGLLRYLSGDASITSQLSLPQAEVSFNYLGQFDWGVQENSFFKLAPESVGPEYSQLGHCSHLLDINGLVVESQLQLHWTYSENFHSSATIESLAQDFVASLRSLIAHCLSADAEGYTPDVFENQTIDSEAQQINNCQRQENNASVPLHLLEVPKGISELLPSDAESAYPLAKMQEFMLHHYTNDHQKMGVYHCQESYDIYDESLDLNAFKKALEISVQRHPTLRTVFITQSRKPVFQVVKKNLRFSINEQDISQIKSSEQENYLDDLVKQDRQNLFNIENPNEPLFRFGIFQKGKNRVEFLMSIHHAITDGWSSIEFLNQLYELYLALKKGEEITVVSAANVYKEFVALEKEIIGSLSASNFWKLHLKDYRYKPLKPLSTSVEQVEAVTEEYNFESEIIADLRELCRKLGVSPKALLLSTFFDLIGTVIKSNRVCVGIISNGRTERLSDPFGALGLFWNIVPFCQPITEDKGVQIKNVQQSLIDIEPYVRYPLLEIFSDQQKPELFFATFNFVNFHNAKNIKADTGLKVNARRSHDKFNFPLNYAVSMEQSSGNVSLNVEYDQLYFSRQEIHSMIQNYIEIFISLKKECDR